MFFYTSVFIRTREISLSAPTYFIADVGSNHDGDINRAKMLIKLAKDSGADAIKFQHFLASKIVSDYGFKSLGSQKSHQATWKKSVYDIYEQYQTPREWTDELVAYAHQVGIDIFTSPYDFEALDLWNAKLDVYKIGSGDITRLDFIEEVAKKGKPVLLATGAADMNDVCAAVEAILKHNSQIVLMQCNTNYTGSSENFKYINLNVLKSFAQKYPGMILGLSDHTLAHATVLGAIALGARVIEKHFTDDNNRQGPDHSFAMNPVSWREMVDRARELEAALGDGIKRVEANELDGVVIQRRSIRLKQGMVQGAVISKDDLEVLRPAPIGSFTPAQLDKVLGKRLKVAKEQGDCLYTEDIE